MPLHKDLNEKIVEFFTSLPNIHQDRTRQSLIFRAGLDNRLLDQISFIGASGEFFALLVPTLISYGKLEDGQNALEAVLDTAKHLVGQDRSNYCDSLLSELREALDREKSSSTISEIEIDDTIQLPEGLTEQEKHAYYVSEARKSITERCLVAADIDKTLIEQNATQQEQARTFFQENVATELIKAANMGVHISPITGNSMHNIATRFFPWLIEKLWTNGDITSLSNFHFFCNSGGIYAHIEADDEVFQMITRKVREKSISKKEIIALFTSTEENMGKTSIHPRFIDASYIERTTIPEMDARKLVRIVEKVTKKFYQKFINNSSYASV